MSIFSKVSEFIKELAKETKSNKGNSTMIYVDFEPPCDWRKDNGSETLVLYLPEFEKEQLRVQVTNLKTVNVSGERQLDEGKTSRFRKRFTAPGDCNAKDIRAKFVDGLLQIKMPKRNSFLDYKQEQVPQTDNSHLGSPKSKHETRQNQASELPNSTNEQESATNKSRKPSSVCTNEETHKFSRFGNLSKVALKVVGITVVVVGLGTLIVYSCLFLLA